MAAVKTSAELERMWAAGQIVAGALAEVRDMIEPGVSTQAIDDMIRDFVKQRGGSLLFYNYKGFPANSCISINEEVVHGIPRRRRKLKDGDIVSVDIGVKYRGFCGDSAWTFPVGKISEQASQLMEVGEMALRKGTEACLVTHRVSDIGRAIQEFVEGEGYFVVKKFVGHGIGKKLHEEPQVPNYVDKGLLKQDPVLRAGMVLAIEPMVNIGTEDVETLDDGWTVVTANRELSVHFEHSVAVTADGPRLLTALQ